MSSQNIVYQQADLAATPQGQPPYYVQPYPVNPQAGQVSAPVIENGKICPNCKRKTENIPTRTMGCASWCWAIWLLPVGLCCLPCCCCEGCKSTNLVCVECNTVKFTSPGSCCWYDRLIHLYITYPLYWYLLKIFFW